MARVTKWLPLSAIRIDRMPLNPSTLRLVDFLRNGGEVKPIQVQKVWEGWCDKLGYCPGYDVLCKEKHLGHYEYHIRDGRHRWLAYKLLGRDKIEVTFGVPS